MRRYLLDTGIASDYINRRCGVYDRVRAGRLQGHRIGIATPVLGELFAGVEASETRDRNLQRLKQHLAHFSLWPFDVAAATEFNSTNQETKVRASTESHLQFR